MAKQNNLSRRHFLLGSALAAAGLVGCGRVEEPLEHLRLGGRKALFYDTYAMALYMDGSLGPKTGIIRAQYLVAGMPMILDFWHGHGGVDHKFQILGDDFEKMKQKQKVTLETDVVASHTHKLFVDFSDPRWRVPGVEPIEIS